MKIVIDARMYGLENTGIGRYVMELIQNLARIDRKNEYLLILKDKYFKELSFPENFRKIRGNFRQYSFAEQIFLLKILMEEKPDLVHFPHFNVPILYRGNYIVTIHDLLMHEQKGFEATTLSPLWYMIKRLGYRIAFDRAVKKSKKIIVPSETIKKEMVKYYKIDENKVAVTYEGVSAFVSSPKEDLVLKKYGIAQPYFIYIGNAYPHKNLKRAIEATALLNSQLSGKVTFVIVSARNFFIKKLEKLISEQKASRFVKVLGFVPDRKMAVLYKKSVAFLFPSLSEGFGIPGLEAMSTGTLVLTSNIPVLKEAYKNHAIYFDPFKFSSIAKAMQQTLEISEEKRKKRIEASRDFVKRYSWHKMARQTLKVYEDCASLRSGK